MEKTKNKYIDLKLNGRLFPTWIMANFKKYKLPEINLDPNVDHCKNIKVESRYKEFLAKYLNYNSPYTDILLYHGTGTGKTATFINIYNMLYNYSPAFNVFLLLKAGLHKGTWVDELKLWLSKDEYEYRYKNLIFVHYDSPFADREFMDAVKRADTSKKSLYLIEESHNFIRNVYTNINSKHGKRAQVIYDYILQDKRDNEGVRVILLSATPMINRPYELALLFNLLRPNIFPKSESQFDQLFISDGETQLLNSTNKNLFQRSIMGLVSYYSGATPEYFASKKIEYVDVIMSDYQTDVYNHYEEIEDKIAKKSKGKSDNTTYKTYTRQSCNFVFPLINQKIKGEERPRPHNFKISEKEAVKLLEGKKNKTLKDSDKLINMRKYQQTLETFTEALKNYLMEKNEDDKQSGYTIENDIKSCFEKYEGNYKTFIESNDKKSNLLLTMYDCSSKFLNVIFNMLKSKGPILAYSNYVLMEGLDIFKIYLEFFGFTKYKSQTEGQKGFRYCEYHGKIDDNERKIMKDTFNKEENKHGDIIKLILISPAGSEGLSLMSVRQVHIIEPYWTEVRIEQMIGRSIRRCSHRYLPINERHVDVYRYKSIKAGRETADQQVENTARKKNVLIQSFQDALKEVAIDCELNKTHNMSMQDYKCFQFDETSLFDKQIGPAYKTDLFDNMQINNGSNFSSVQRVKVYKIFAVMKLSKDGEQEKYSKKINYWFNPDTNIVYDHEMHYAIGKVGYDSEGFPLKLDKNTYIIDEMINIPMLED